MHTQVLSCHLNCHCTMVISQSSDKCFKCHELGHWAKNCSNDSTQEQVPHDSLGNENSDICFKCHELGHWAKDCPNNSTEEQVLHVLLGSKSSDKCFRCQELGHWAKDCPNKSTGEQVPHSSLGNGVIPPKMCSCPRECRILVSNTFRNPGRKFYSCKRCKFFEWCEEREPSASQNPNCQSRNLNPSRSPNSPMRNPNSSAHEEFGSQQQFASLGCSGMIEWSYESSIPCECEAGPCRVLALKTGRNECLQYFTCPSKKGEGSCRFFKWCDKLDSAASSSSTLSNNSVRAEPEVRVRRNGA